MLANLKFHKNYMFILFLNFNLFSNTNIFKIFHISSSIILIFLSKFHDHYIKSIKNIIYQTLSIIINFC